MIDDIAFVLGFLTGVAAQLVCSWADRRLRDRRAREDEDYLRVQLGQIRRRLDPNEPPPNTYIYEGQDPEKHGRPYP